MQAAATRDALGNFPFKACFASPVTRAAESARIMWPEHEHCSEGDDGIIFLDSLREAHLGWLQGMTNRFAAEEHGDVYRALSFCIYGVRWGPAPCRLHRRLQCAANSSCLVFFCLALSCTFAWCISSPAASRA